MGQTRGRSDNLNVKITLLCLVWIRLDPAARNKANSKITESEDRQTWIIEQTLVDPEELNDFQITFSLSMTEAKENGTVKIIPLELKSIAE
ncbi:MAG: DUF3516 domain-containing protein [Opitutaceae bacterium]